MASAVSSNALSKICPIHKNAAFYMNEQFTLLNIDSFKSSLKQKSSSKKKKKRRRKKNMFCIVLFDTIWLGNVGACTWRRPRREVVWSATRCCCSGCKIPTFSRSPRYIKHHRANIHTLLTHTKPIHISYLFTIVIKDPTQKK